MVMNHPGAFVEPQHGHVAEYGTFVLINEMAGNVRIAGIDFGVGFFYLFFVFLDGGVSGLWDPVTERLDDTSSIGPLIVVTKRNSE